MSNSIIERIFNYENEYPDKVCLIDDQCEVTYRQYAEKIRKYAQGLYESGLKEKDTVVIEACPTIENLSIQMAVYLIGAVFVPVEQHCAKEKIDRFIKNTSAKAVITLKDNKYEVEISMTYEDTRKFEEKMPYILKRELKEDDICEILFSTGTTGKEKGIIITHRNNLALAENVLYGVEMQKDNIELIACPMNHSHGLRRYYANMYNGSTVALLGNVMNIKRFIELLDKYNVNSIDLVPAALSIILHLTKGKLSEYKDQIRYIQFGSAPMREEDKVKICELLPNTRLYNFYGSTESGCISIYNFNCNNSKKNCIGKPTYNANIVITDENRNIISSSKDNSGHIASYGKMNMLGYWKDEEETKKVLKEGIIYSNDIAYFDEDGDILLLGRKGDVINVGGHKVSPDEIEDVARKIECVADCAVIPVEDKFKGNVPKLFVQMKNGYEFDAAFIRNFITENVEQYKVPQYIEQIDKIPRSYNGKILRRELK